MKKKSVIVFGSTGSIGVQAVDIISDHSEFFDVWALTGHKNIDLLASQALLLNPRFIVIPEHCDVFSLQQRLSGLRTKVLIGWPMLYEVISDKVDIIIFAISGIAGVGLAVSAVQSCRVFGVANKETIVCAWGLLSTNAAKHGTKVIPIDSEHNSLMQVIEGHESNQIKNLFITASGGPFLDYTASQLEAVTPMEARNHPVWKMGVRISIDSATMMNKALEIIEANRIFENKNIQVLIHPEAIVHCMVELVDGFCLAGLSIPDMRIHIANALFWPERKGQIGASLDLSNIGSLNFRAVDTTRFPAVRIAYDVLQGSESDAVVMGAANEEAVDMFLRGEIKFTQITDIIDQVLQDCERGVIDSVDSILYYSRMARFLARKSYVN